MSTLVKADDTRYEWAPIPAAKYYQGTIEQHGVTTRFRTQSHWLILPSNASIKLSAYALDAHELSPITLKNSHFSATNTASDKPASLPERTDEPQTEPAAPDGEGADDGDDPDDDTTVATEPSDETGRDADHDIRRPLNGYMTIQLGIGKEWLKASGGISTYDGSANVGGTIISGAAITKDSRWSFPLTVAAHNFSTKVSASRDGQKVESQAKFLHLNARAGAAFDIFRGTRAADGPAVHGMTVGVGLSYVRLPLLAINSDLLGTANLENNAGFGPYIGAGYTRYFDADNLAGFAYAVVPASLSKDVKALGSSSLVYWRQVVTQRLYMEIGFVIESTSISTKVDCPNVVGCETASQSSDRLIQARLGIGTHF